MRADPLPHPPDRDGDLVVVPRAQLDALVENVASLQARLDALEDRPPETAPVAAPHRPAAMGRRRALAGLAGAAAAGAAAVVASGQPAAAANGDPIVIGSNTNIGSAPTGLAVTGSLVGYGFGITDNGLASYSGTTAILGHTKGQAFSVGVHGLASGGSTAILAEAGPGTGVWSITSTGQALVAQNVSTVAPAATIDNSAAGGRAVTLSGTTPLVLNPQPGSPTTSPYPGSIGSLRWTDDGLWACVANGTPGTWRRLAHASTAGAFHLLPTPVRVYDSRAGTQPSQGPKTPLPAGNVARTIDCKHNGSGVPAGATGVLLTVLLANAATGNGNLTTWAADKPKPGSNTMVWGGDAGRFTALAVSALDPQARIKIDASLSTNVVLDVVGYYR